MRFFLSTWLALTTLATATPMPLPLQNPSYDALFGGAPRAYRRGLLDGLQAAGPSSGGVANALSVTSLVGKTGLLGGVLGGPPSRRGLVGDVSVNNLLGDVGILNTYCIGSSQDAKSMKVLASQSASKSASNKAYAQHCAATTSSFHTNLLGFRDVLARVGRDKGLANYDRADAVQTALKNVVNANKNLLSSVDVIVANVPGLGPVLGPIVYEVKCILDDVLNSVENVADGVLNGVKPALKGVISQASGTCCRSGLQVAGLCLLG